MKINLDSSDQEIRIEIVPLIDVIFCILTFFILAAIGLTRQQGIGVDLPQASTGQPQMRKLAMVALSPAGQLYFQQAPVTKEALLTQLQAFKQAQPDGTIVLYASQSAFYSDVVAVLDLLRSVGGDRVALATLPSGQNPAQRPADNFDPFGNQPLVPNDPSQGGDFGNPGFNSPGFNNSNPNNSSPNNSNPNNSNPSSPNNPGLGGNGLNQPYLLPNQAPAPAQPGDRLPIQP